MRGIATTFLLLTILGSSPNYAAEGWVPPGFESLSEPQTTAIDVYYGGYFLTTTMARFDHSALTFVDSKVIVQRIPDILNPEEIELLLGRPLPLNAELLCHSEFQLDCGELQPADIGIIFDRANLRVWLFMHPELLVTRQAQERKYLPRSSGELSMYSENSLFFSDTGLESTSYNLANYTQLALAENRLQIRSNLTDAGIELDTLALSREFSGRRVSLGLLREDASNSSFMQSEQYVGFALQSSLETRTDLDQIQGSQIELFLNTRSRVEIYRDGRLYDTHYYNIGNQVLDTSSLPSGSYDIEIRITDAAGEQRIEQRFFTKNSRMAPSDQNLYFLQAGKLLGPTDEIADSNQQEFFRAGFAKRLTDSVGADIGVSLTPDSTLLEAGLFKQGENYQFHAGIAHEDNGSTGFTTDLRFALNKITANLNLRRLFAGKSDSQLGSAFTQIAASLEYRTPIGPIGLFYRNNSRSDEFSATNMGLRWRSQMRELGKGNLTASFELSRNDSDLLAAFTLNYRFNGDRRSSSYSAQAQYENRERGNARHAFRGSAESRWNIARGNDNQFSLRAERSTQSSLEGRLELAGRLGSADVSTRYNMDSSRAEFYGRLSSSFAATRESSAVGGQRRGDSVLLVEVDGVPSHHNFEVLVNGSPRGQLSSNETLLLPVSPFETYDISLKTLGDSIVNLDARHYRKTVYPGNVIDLTWQATEVVIAYGRILDSANNPVSNALLGNVMGLATTDSNGYFQVEIDRHTDTLEVRKGGQTCRIALEDQTRNEQLMALGDLKCGNGFYDETQNDSLLVGGL